MEDPFIIRVLRDISDISYLLTQYFKDEDKTNLWLNSINPSLNNQVPSNLIFEGKSDQLKDFIKNNFNVEE